MSYIFLTADHGYCIETSLSQSKNCFWSKWYNLKTVQDGKIGLSNKNRGLNVE